MSQCKACNAGMIENARQRGVRSDALPEEANYRDTGCDLHPVCLSCPFPRCRYDSGAGILTGTYGRTHQRVAEARRLVSEGLTQQAIATHMGLSRRTIVRLLSPDYGPNTSASE